MSGLSRVQASKWGPFTTLGGYVGRGQQGEIERIHPPPTNSKNIFKSFCEAGYANFRPNVFAAGKRILMEILVGVELHAWCPGALKDLTIFQKTEMCNKNIYRLCNVKWLEQDIKSCCYSHFLWNAWKLKCSTVRVICTCDQYDLVFCALQLTTLIKPNWYILLSYYITVRVYIQIRYWWKQAELQYHVQQQI